MNIHSTILYQKEQFKIYVVRLIIFWLKSVLVNNRMVDELINIVTLSLELIHIIGNKITVYTIQKTAFKKLIIYSIANILNKKVPCRTINRFVSNMRRSFIACADISSWRHLDNDPHLRKIILKICRNYRLVWAHHTLNEKLFSGVTSLKLSTKIKEKIAIIDKRITPYLWVL